MCQRAGMASVVLRLFNTYGLRQALSPYVGVVTIFIDKLLRAEEPVIFGDGEQCRDFVDVRDVARGFIRSMEAGVSGDTINIGSGSPHTVNQILATLNQCMGTAMPGRHVRPVSGELSYSVADISKARHLLGYEPIEQFGPSLMALTAEARKCVAALS